MRRLAFAAVAALSVLFGADAAFAGDRGGEPEFGFGIWIGSDGGHRQPHYGHAYPPPPPPYYHRAHRHDRHREHRRHGHHYGHDGHPRGHGRPIYAGPPPYGYYYGEKPRRHEDHHYRHRRHHDDD